MPSNTQLDPEDFAGPSSTLWDHARREYLAGMTAASICQRYGMSLSSFRLHARVGGWRRIDQPASDLAPEPGEHHPAVMFAERGSASLTVLARSDTSADRDPNRGGATCL